MKTKRKAKKQRTATVGAHSPAGQKPEDGLFLDLDAWKELQAQLSAPPSEALRRFMATPSTVSDDLEQILLERQRVNA
jgi:hypothetical protein